MNKWKTVTLEVGPNGEVRFLGRIIKPRKASGLRKNARSYYHGIHIPHHRLVATAYHGQPDDNRNTVNHIDGDRANNHPSNLEWCTSKENAQRAVFRLRGEAHFNAHLTAEQVLHISANQPKGARELADKYDLTPTRIWQLRSGRGGKGSLTIPADVLAKIREQGSPANAARRLAEEYGVTTATIRHIWRRKTWKHL